VELLINQNRHVCSGLVVNLQNRGSEVPEYYQVPEFVTS